MSPSKLSWSWSWLLLGVTSCGPEMDGAQALENVAQVAQAATSQTLSGQWACPANAICEDHYQIDVPALTDVTIAVSSSSTILLSALVPPSLRENLLTGNFNDRRCPSPPSTAATKTDRVTFRTATAGRYEFVFGRDPLGSSSDGRGTYTATITANKSFTFVQKSADDIPRDRYGIGDGYCGYSKELGGHWNNCTNGCQDIYDIEVRAGAEVTLSAAQYRKGIAPRLAVFGPSIAPSGTNLLTGVNKDRKCFTEVADNTKYDNVKFVAVNAGVYRIAVGRDAGADTGSVQYTASFGVSDLVNLPFYRGQTAEDVPSQAQGTRCGYTFTTTGSWSCPAFFDCQKSYYFDLVTSPGSTYLPTNSPVDISVTNVTGGAATRLAVQAQGAPVSWNLLNGKFTERACATANGNDFVTLGPTIGRLRFSVGRQGAPTTVTGTYRLNITTPDVVMIPRGQAPTSELPIYGATSCP